MATGLLLGYLADRAVGDPVRWHPVAGFGQAARALEQRVYDDAPGAGAVFCLTAVAVPTAVAVLVQRRLAADPVRLALLTAAVTWAALGGRQLGQVAQRIGDHLQADQVDEARALMPWLVGRDPASLDADDMARAVVESVAENTADAVVATLLWGAVAGPAGVVAHRAANTLDAMVGHRTARYLRFGATAARLDDALGLLPARVTAALTAIAAPAVGGSTRASLRAWRRDGGRHPSPNAGPVEAAAAGALGCTLGGPTTYGGRVEVRGPLGEGPPPAVGDIDRVVRLTRLVGALATGLACLIATARTRRPFP